MSVKFVTTLEVGPVMVFLASKRGRFLELDFRNVGVIPAEVVIVVELAPGERIEQSRSSRRMRSQHRQCDRLLFR